MSVRLLVLVVAALSGLTGCSLDTDRGLFDPMVATAPDMAVGDQNEMAATTEGAIVHDETSNGIEPLPLHERASVADEPMVAHQVAWGEPTVLPSELIGPKAVADTDGPYLLDTGDRLRVFVYGQPNLSRLYVVGHDGKIVVPLIGSVMARGRTTSEVQAKVRARLGAEYVKDPQVTVDIHQNRPFFILGEVRSPGQYPYVSGMTVETAIAIGGGHTERANERKYRITRRVNGFVERIEAPGDYVIRPGDTIYVFERFF